MARDHVHKAQAEEYDFHGSVYRFNVLLCVCIVPWPYVIYYVLLSHDVACMC